VSVQKSVCPCSLRLSARTMLCREESERLVREAHETIDATKRMIAESKKLIRKKALV
jgi:hypothetical protein